MKLFPRGAKVFKSNQKIFLISCLFIILSYFACLSWAQTIRLENYMKEVTEGILKSKKTKSLFKKKTKLLKTAGIIGKRTDLIMVGFDYDAEGKDDVNINAYLYHDTEKPF